MRCCVVAVLVVGFSSLTACGASNVALAPRISATSVRPLTDVLYSFGGSPDAKNPYAGLLAGKKGEYYGTSVYGGSYGDGAVYEITAAGKERVIYSFQGNPDGANPYSTLIMDKEGALYGDTFYGGTTSGDGDGTVFKLTPGKQGWTERVLYDFQGGPADGAFPQGGLVLTKSGALLGTTWTGGKAYSGVVFELTPSGSTYSETVICSFGNGCSFGLDPTAPLVADGSGNFYGTTTDGGFCGCGSAFRLTPSGSTYTFSTIYYFKGRRAGDAPSSGLLPGPHGVLFGTTQATGAGTVYKLTPSGSTYIHTVIYRFKGGSDGKDPAIRRGSSPIGAATCMARR